MTHRYWHADGAICDVTSDRETAHRWVLEEEGSVRDERPIMGFQDLLAHLDSVFSRIERLNINPSHALPPFQATHVFNLGDSEDKEDFIESMWSEELNEECRETILAPFPDLTWVEKATNNYGNRGWIISRVVEVAPGRVPGQPFILFDYSVKRASEPGEPLITPFWYRGCDEGEPFKGFSGEGVRIDLERSLFRGESSDPEMNAAAGTLRTMAAVSHPANYIVQVTPRLTVREERQEKRGRRNPAKKPHFIVIDHDVLVCLDPKRNAGGTHVSPVPHHRRGHWRRLSERCRQARRRGDKVIVRPSYVGDRKFSDEKSYYEVLLDFGKRGMPEVSGRWAL